MLFSVLHGAYDLFLRPCKIPLEDTDYRRFTHVGFPQKCGDLLVLFIDVDLDPDPHVHSAREERASKN